MSFYLYYSGLTNLCHYWCSKASEEYAKYGETEKMHEILLTISRTYAGIMVSAIVSILFRLCQICSQISASVFNYGYMTFEWTSFGITILNGCNNITTCIAIYFVYPFAYHHYRKISGRCHEIVYSYFEKRQQRMRGNTQESVTGSIAFDQRLLNGDYEEPQFTLLDEQ